MENPRDLNDYLELRTMYPLTTIIQTLETLGCKRFILPKSAREAIQGKVYKMAKGYQIELFTAQNTSTATIIDITDETHVAIWSMKGMM